MTSKKSHDEQKRRIDELIRDIKWLQTSRDGYAEDLREMRPKAEFYLTIQRRVIKDLEAQEAMQRFLMIMRLTLSEDIRGFTTQ